MATATSRFDPLVRDASSRDHLAPLLEALGFQPAMEDVPREAWPAYGLETGPPLRALHVAGHAGRLDALLLEVVPGPGDDGRAEALSDIAARLARAVRRRNAARLHLFVVCETGFRRLVLGTFGLGEGFRHLTVDRDRVRPSDLDALEEMAPAAGEQGLELALRQVRALDRSRVTRRFFGDFRAQRTAVAAAWSGLPASSARERRQLALLFLSRLTFLCFLQERRALLGDDRYLARLWADGAGAAGAGEISFYRRTVVPLFFGALNRRPGDRSAAAHRLGPLPYLNGGLFEAHTLERAHPDLDLPDPVVESVLFDLLERYRFTAREAADGAGYGVDPEVLGRVFEGLMEQDRKGDTGTFYTPAAVVDRVVKEGLAEYVTGACPDVDGAALVDGSGVPRDAATRHRVRGVLERVRILDPACGSGAFLLGALHSLGRALGAVSDRPSGAVRREIVGRSLHGVDLLDDAALLCSLRLWLALSCDGEIGPLPNLDRRIRQGDALIDPLDLGTLDGDAVAGLHLHPLRDPALRRALAAVGPAGRRYLESSPVDRDSARARLARVERDLARRWVDRLSLMDAHRARRLGAEAADRDLFGESPPHARRAQRASRRVEEHREELERVRVALEEDGALPFFSFGVHFADAADGFDLIVSNPPWVRAHRWPDRLRKVSKRYDVCRSAGWPAAAELTGAPAGAGAQVDLSLLFVEKSLRLLAPGGVLAVLLPAKALRALYGGAARRMLLQDLEFALIEDHALHHRSIFDADTFAAVLIGRRRARSAPDTERPARLRMVQRGREPLEVVVRQRDLPLFPDDPASPWILAPPAVTAALRAMQAVGPPLGRHPELRARRGVMTGANRELVLKRVEPKLGGLSRIEAEGYAASRRDGAAARSAGRYRAHVETRAVRPLVRGADIDAFCYRTERYVVWCHDGEARPAEPPQRMARYLNRHRERLESRPGWRPGLPLGAVFRLSGNTLRPKVAWHDLSDTLRAVALPDRIELDGARVELVPLNTVYFLPVPDPAAAMVLAALLNSLPVRTFARAIAERAKDARFRFFAWTVSATPLPPGWRAAVPAAELEAVGRRASARGGLEPEDQERLDRAAAALYGLGPHDVDALKRFDRWLKGDAA